MIAASAFGAGAEWPSCTADVAAAVQQAVASGNGPGPKALAAITEASKHMGTDYKWGGSTPQTGFDCSGLMQWSYAQSGIQIPRVADDPDRGAGRHRDRRPRRAHARRPRGLRRPTATSTTSACTSAKSSSYTRRHRRRGEGLEPRRAVLRRAVRGRATVRRRRARRRRPGRARPVAAAAPPPDRPDRGRQGPGRGRPRRRRGAPQRLAAVHGRSARRSEQGRARPTGTPRRCS